MRSRCRHFGGMKRPSPSAASWRPCRVQQWAEALHHSGCIRLWQQSCDAVRHQRLRWNPAICQLEQNSKVPVSAESVCCFIHSIFIRSISSGVLISRLPRILKKWTPPSDFFSTYTRTYKNKMSERLLPQYNYTATRVTIASHLQVPHKMVICGEEKKTHKTWWVSPWSPFTG